MTQMMSGQEICLVNNQYFKSYHMLYCLLDNSDYTPIIDAGASNFHDTNKQWLPWSNKVVSQNSSLYVAILINVLELHP